MAIRRSKWQRGKVGSGRPRKLAPPPLSPTTQRNVSLWLIEPQDLIELANTVGLEPTLRGPAFLEFATEAINDAFSGYANAAAMQAANASPGQRRDWCAGVERGCADLLRGLGYSEPSGELAQSTWDAFDSLHKWWLSNPHTPLDRELADRLKLLFMVAVPDTYASTSKHGGEQNLADCWWNLLGRLGPALAAVATVAQSAHRAWAAEVAPSKDRGRRYLIETLIPVFVELFGRPPEAAPGSPGFRWFSALVEHASRRASAQHGMFGPHPEASPEIRAAALAAIEALARRLVPERYGRKATLDHWLREGRKACRIQTAIAASKRSTPCAPRTRGAKAIKHE